jgi:hypothetical protein
MSTLYYIKKKKIAVLSWPTGQAERFVHLFQKATAPTQHVKGFRSSAKYQEHIFAESYISAAMKFSSPILHSLTIINK